MAIPAGVMAAAQLAPLFLSFFGGGREQTIDPSAQFAKILRLLGPQFAPIIRGIESQAQRQGAAAAQRLQGVLGPSGGGSSGIGATARSLSTGFQSARSSDARLQAQQAMLQLAAQMLPGFKPTTFQKPATGFQNFQTALGLSSLGGQNPLEQVVNLFQNFNKKQGPNFQQTSGAQQAALPGLEFL